MSYSEKVGWSGIFWNHVMYLRRFTPFKAHWLLACVSNVLANFFVYVYIFFYKRTIYFEVHFCPTAPGNPPTNPFICVSSILPFHPTVNAHVLMNLIYLPGKTVAPLRLLWACFCTFTKCYGPQVTAGMYTSPSAGLRKVHKYIVCLCFECIYLLFTERWQPGLLYRHQDCKQPLCRARPRDALIGPGCWTER